MGPEGLSVFKAFDTTAQSFSKEVVLIYPSIDRVRAAQISVLINTGAV